MTPEGIVANLKRHLQKVGEAVLRTLMAPPKLSALSINQQRRLNWKSNNVVQFVPQHRKGEGEGSGTQAM